MSFLLMICNSLLTSVYYCFDLRKDRSNRMICNSFYVTNYGTIVAVINRLCSADQILTFLLKNCDCQRLFAAGKLQMDRIETMLKILHFYMTGRKCCTFVYSEVVKHSCLDLFTKS